MKKIYFLAAAFAIPLMADAQSAIDAFRISQPDMKGTARYMGMGGAFGALGGDLTSISSNPAGIGVYRRNEIGVTMDIDVQNASTEAQGYKNNQSQTKVLLNNVGGVASWNLANPVMPNINIGFTYNRAASFNSHYIGGINQLRGSLSNYIAAISNEYGLNEGDLETLLDNNGNITFDPYNQPNNNGEYAPWLSILGYDSYFMTPEGDPDQTQWKGQWDATTSGSGAFEVLTTGAVNEYNFAIGGNLYNKVFWGIDFGIVDLDYSLTSIWQESLQNAYVDFDESSAYWDMLNRYNVNGTGFNLKLGFIYRPIQELRLGISCETPTWYAINESYIASTDFNYPELNIPNRDDPKDRGYQVTNQGNWGLNSYNFRTPWRLTASAAGVINNNLILSADLEWKWYNKMRFYNAGDDIYGYDDDFGYDYIMPYGMSMINPDPWSPTNSDIENYYKPTTTVRVGAEYRITPRFSIRAGYSNVSSPVSKEAKDGSLRVYTAGTRPDYTWNNSTNYITCGLGYNFNNFYIDAAYVNKSMSSEYHAYSRIPDYPDVTSPTAKVSYSNNQVILTAGFKF